MLSPDSVILRRAPEVPDRAPPPRKELGDSYRVDACGSRSLSPARCVGDVKSGSRTKATRVGEDVG